MKIILAFLWRDILNEISYKLSFFLQLLSMFPVVLMFFFLSSIVGNSIEGPLHPYGGDYFPFVLVGIALQNYLNLSLSSFSANIRESQLSGTLEAVLIAPVSLSLFILGSTAYSFILNSLRIIIYLGIGALFFGVKFRYSQLLLTTGIIILTVASFSSMGIFSACFIILFKKGDPLNWAFGVLSWLMGGVYYPVSVLPEWMQKAAYFIPMTHSLEALRLSLLAGEGFFSMTSHLAALALWTIIGLPISLLSFRYAMNRARVQGNLGHY